MVAEDLYLLVIGISVLMGSGFKVQDIKRFPVQRSGFRVPRSSFKVQLRILELLNL
jgi:hypothetical protein